MSMYVHSHTTTLFQPYVILVYLHMLGFRMSYCVKLLYDDVLYGFFSCSEWNINKNLAVSFCHSHENMKACRTHTTERKWTSCQFSCVWWISWCVKDWILLYPLKLYKFKKTQLHFLESCIRNRTNQGFMNIIKKKFVVVW